MGIVEPDGERVIWRMKGQAVPDAMRLLRRCAVARTRDTSIFTQ